MLYQCVLSNGNEQVPGDASEDFDALCKWAKDASANFPGYDAVVYGNASCLFVYRDGNKCDLGGVPMPLPNARLIAASPCLFVCP